MADTIPQITPWIDAAKLEMLKKVVESTFVTEHRLTQEFEERIRALTGAGHAIAFMNGTAALYAAMRALGLEPGDEVLVPDLTFIATANAVIMAGGRPVFVDVHPDSFCFDPDAIEAALTPRTRGICPVHLYGLSPDMDAILRIARARGLWVLEDAAQGVAVRWKGRHVGTFGEAGVLSFYGNKTITTGEGGVILTDDDTLARACYRLKNHGRDRKGVFEHDHVGFNFSFTEMQAAVGLAQLDKLPRIVARKAEIHARYRAALGDTRGVAFPVVPPGVTPVFWFTSILVDDPEALADALDRRGIQTRRFFRPLHEQPCYRDMDLDLTPRPNSLRAYRRGLSLPSSVQLTGSEQERVIEGVRDFFHAAAPLTGRS